MGQKPGRGFQSQPVEGKLALVARFALLLPKAPARKLAPTQAHTERSLLHPHSLRMAEVFRIARCSIMEGGISPGVKNTQRSQAGTQVLNVH